MLKGKKILLGITGSIAAYKAIHILRRLRAADAEVSVVLTSSAHRFVSPLTLQVLSNGPIYTDLFDPRSEVIHLTLAQEADLILIAPATANFIAKMATGLADDLLSNLLLANTAPILLAPAMDLGMWEHPAVQENVMRLRLRGVHILEPEVGPLASGKEGKGRLADEGLIVAGVIDILSGNKEPEGWDISLKDEVILVTAGPTREPIDPVRFISNRSSGRMGYALADAAHRCGGRVILISGPTALSPPPGVEYFSVETAAEMKKAVDYYFDQATVVIMAAAVSDYTPKNISAKKIKKTETPISIPLQKTEDILKRLSSKKKEQILIGFAAETEDLIQNAQLKLKNKGLDLIVANDVTQKGAGFDVETNIVQLIDRDGQITALSKMLKTELARYILREIRTIREGQK
ncbi:MAG: bifunctional phosphopantothenoylcysteine decarboxylase/phosphopantothenate--cysteine ligase CoaBC [Nitrospira sp.]|nr:bifunctional phosphopantothenoylcysteine decarboxylase/phosphopantothenate--cysteine ligase CoaBC [Candidatus Manganitrophaceae bacterium]HIL35811.1 bifunctional phosphopantothenoylcysteine decarboxylase/phosphopantothenate--cysteine ligase CoaBC [Candidatus Manganitrophaceae bacterium]